MIATRKLEIPCPACGSLDVSYSCSPSCCFNHVCGECYTTFEPLTVSAGGGRLNGVSPPDPLPEAADPTVACVKCDSIKVYLMGDGPAVVCAGCGELLTIELTEIAAG